MKQHQQQKQKIDEINNDSILDYNSPVMFIDSTFPISHVTNLPSHSSVSASTNFFCPHKSEHLSNDINVLSEGKGCNMKCASPPPPTQSTVHSSSTDVVVSTKNYIHPVSNNSQVATLTTNSGTFAFRNIDGKSFSNKSAQSKNSAPSDQINSPRNTLIKSNSNLVSIVDNNKCGNSIPTEVTGSTILNEKTFESDFKNDYGDWSRQEKCINIYSKKDHTCGEDKKFSSSVNSINSKFNILNDDNNLNSVTFGGTSVVDDDSSMDKVKGLTNSTVNEVMKDENNYDNDDDEVTRSKFNLILMVILGDAVHNFIDGLSLGAGLIDSHLTGCSIATAILFEEIPHELGDFWILLSSGMSIKSAIKLNLFSSISCYAGLVCGLLIGENWGGNSAIFAITAGMFFYIALFNVLNDLKNNLEIVRSLSENSFYSVSQILICQNIGIITGVALLYRLAIIDERLLFQSLRINL